MKHTMQIEGMSCAHCVARVENALKGLDGVLSAGVDLEKGTAQVEFDENVTTVETMIAAIDDVGFVARAE